MLSAGAVGVLDVIDTVSTLLAAPRLPEGPVQLSLAGSSVEAGELGQQLAAALSSIAEKNEAAAEAARQEEQEEEAPAAAAKPAIGLFGIGTRKVRVLDCGLAELHAVDVCACRWCAMSVWMSSSM
jgi:hypothetical protein